MESDMVVLRDSLGGVADSVQWSARTWGEWPRGKSRVRVSDPLPGSDPAAWRASRASLGASPGWLEPPAESGAESFVLEAVRKAVRPGERSLLRLRATGIVRVEIFDLARRRLGVLLDGEPPAAGVLEWDGRVDGRNLTPGVYLVLATCGMDSRREWIAVGKP